MAVFCVRGVQVLTDLKLLYVMMQHEEGPPAKKNLLDLWVGLPYIGFMSTAYEPSREPYHGSSTEVWTVGYCGRGAGDSRSDYAAAKLSLPALYIKRF